MTKNHQFNPSGGIIRSSFHLVIVFLISILLIVHIYLLEVRNVAHTSSEDELLSSRCNFFSGKWVYDNKSYPLYKEQKCTFMSDELACEKFGRKDSNYQFWRWQPHQCDLPMFNATALLETLRNKRLVFVGDSLGRGQWVSLVCLVESNIPAPLKSMHKNASFLTFKAIEYNATIEFYWAPLLVESNSDDPTNHRIHNRIIRVSVEKHARHWTDADILVFDSYIWWGSPHIKVSWGSFESQDGIYKEIGMTRAYEMALKTWSGWLEFHVNRNKTQLFFVSMSPFHHNADAWGGGEGQNCYNETEAIEMEGYRGMVWDLNQNMMRVVVEKELNELQRRGLNVQMLNITRLSEYRKEAHPSIYRKQWQPLTDEQLSNPRSYADCIHWCLPGVPDVWNQLLYVYILHI